MASNPAKLLGLRCWKIRVATNSTCFHLLSETEPELQYTAGKLTGMDWTPISNTHHGDTLYFIEWSAVIGVAARKSEEGDD